jgi:lipoate-protein ligase A
MEKNWRLILDTHQDGYYNMAVDEALLLSYKMNRQPVLRIYGWDFPFVSIGYNQNINNILGDQPNIPFVRRMTGGAAILHDHELTYSLVCSTYDLDLNKSVKESYKQLCSFLLKFYQRLGLTVNFGIDNMSDNLKPYNEFCFSSWEAYDLIVDNKKLGGNAQRRCHDIIFQHGSIPLTIDISLAKEIISGTVDYDRSVTTLYNHSLNTISWDTLQQMLANSFSDIFDLSFYKQDLNGAENEMIKKLIKEKYEQDQWNYNKKKAELVS